MVLESLIDPTKAEKKQWVMFFIGFLLATVGMWLGYWVFKSSASLVMVFLTVLGAVPLIYNTIKLEEMKDLSITNERALLKEHGKALSFFMFLFLGITISCTFWYVVLPSDMLPSLFSTQTETITQINTKVTGNFIEEFSFFWKIFANNLMVLIFCIVFAFLYGAGSIFILVWNASVLGVALGNFVRLGVEQLAASGGLSTAAGYLHVVSFGFLKYAIHGFPEILAYFVAGLAGGIISIAVIRHDFGTNKFKNILIDSADLLIISVVLLFVAALLEVFVTPVLL